ncbi:MAG: cation-translocating P-type ATPase C-terminal domain-containing protein, partial [Pseudoflavonifractor sp.]
IGFLLSGNMAGILCVLFTSLLNLPVPFAPVHLLFINLLTDSLPAIAIGMEPARDGLLDQRPRDPKEPILTKRFAGKILLQGGLIAIATMAAYFVGLDTGSKGLAMTMAFSTLTLARLFHGFNSRGKNSIFKLGLMSNKYCLGAFAGGVLLLVAVLFVPGVNTLFLVTTPSLAQCGIIAALAFAPTAIIQIFKVIRDGLGK